MGAENPQDNQSDAVLFETRPCRERAMGIITLNNPRKFNILTLPMVRAIQKQLDDWAEDDNIALIVLCGAGEKAFCAGGDVRAIHDVVKENQGPPRE